MEYPYKVFTADGSLVLQATENCRYGKVTELSMLDLGYTITLHGRKLTKKEARARLS